jgi:hypothetical protein
MPSGVHVVDVGDHRVEFGEQVSPRSAAASSQATPSPAPTAARQSWSPVWHDKHVTDPGPVETRRRRPDQVDVEHDLLGHDRADVADASFGADADRIGEPRVDGGDRRDLHQREAALPRQVLGGVERSAAAEADDHLGAVVGGVLDVPASVELADLHVASGDDRDRCRNTGSAIDDHGGSLTAIGGRYAGWPWWFA